MADRIQHWSAGGYIDRPLKELIADAGREALLLVRQELDLAKAELGEKAAQAAKGAAAGAAAGILAHTGALALLAALVLGMAALGVAAWLAALVVAGVALGAALVLVGRARRAFTRSGGLAPRRTVALTKETIDWARNGGRS